LRSKESVATRAQARESDQFGGEASGRSSTQIAVARIVMARRSKMLAKSKFGRPSRNGQGQAERAARGRGEKKSQRGRERELHADCVAVDNANVRCLNLSRSRDSDPNAEKGQVSR
jgi:hypothetical protein